MVSPIIPLIVVLVLFILLDTVSSLVADIFIFIYFLFAYINISGQTTLATFYLFAIVFVIATRLAKPTFTLKSEKITKFGGFVNKGKIPIIGVVLGIVIWFGMRTIQSTQAGAIIGTPSLAITSDVFNITTIMLLGIVENRFFFTIYNLIKENVLLFTRIPLLGGIFAPFILIIPIVFTAVLFATFHITAYALSLSALLFASIVMVIWLITFILTKNDLAPNIAHALWNGTIALSRTLGIAL